MRWTLITKLVVAYSGLIAIMAGSLSLTIYWQLRHYSQTALGDRLRALTSLAARQIDSDYHSLINRPEDAQSVYYNVNRQQLQAIQATDPDILRLSTLRWQVDRYTIVLDYLPPTHSATEPLRAVGTTPQELPPSLQTEAVIQTAMTEAQFTKNQDGRLVLYGYAPLQNELGRVDGVLVIEMDATDVSESTAWALTIAGGIFLIVLGVSLPLVWWLGQSVVVRPTLHLNVVARRLAEGQWDAALPTQRSDELGQLANSIGHMATQLQSSFQQLQDYSQNLEQKVAARTAELSESQQLLHSVIDNIPQSIFWKDPDNIYLGCNRSFAEVASMPPEEIIGKTDYDLPWSREEADFYIECDRQVMNAGVPTLGIVEPITRGDGTHGWLETNKVPLHDVVGQVIGVIGIFQDITHYKEAEAAAQQASQAKSNFLANMSHELRTPLNGVLGYAQILAAAPELSDKSRNGVHTIHQCGSHLLTLINDVLDLAKIEAGKLELVPTPVHLPSLLQGVVEMCDIKAQQRQIKFVYRPSERLPEGVLVDEKCLRQVLINLLGNAIKFTDQGYVTLSIEVLDATPETADLQFRVEDTGVGIASRDLDKLFAAFEQVGDRAKQAEGTGLGLAISQQIVHLMQSQIEVTSQLGQGSQFSFRVKLPITQDWQRLLKQTNTVQAVRYQGDRLKLLIIDDHQENRDVVAGLLEPLDVEVKTAENGLLGLHQIKQERPHLIILDIVMPVMDGFEFLDQVRSDPNLRELKIIVSSASVSHADHQMALAAGGDDFLPKPIDRKQLLACLDTHLQLDWQQSTPVPVLRAQEDSEISGACLPAPDKLQELLTIAQSGSILKTRQALETLNHSDRRYHGFIETLLPLARQYKVEEIEALLKQTLSQGAS